MNHRRLGLCALLGALLLACAAGIVLWSLAPRANVRVRATLDGFRHSVRRLVFSADSQLLALADEERIRVYELVSLTEKLNMEIEDRVACLRFSEDGKKLAVHSKQTMVGIWDLSNPVEPSIHSVKGGRRGAFSPDLKLLVTGAEDGSIHLSRLDTERDHSLRSYTRRREGPSSEENRAAVVVDPVFSPDGRMVAAGDDGGRVQLWDVATREQLASWNSGDRVTSIAFSPNNRQLASSHYGCVFLWDLDSFEKRVVVENRSYSWVFARFKDDQTLVTASDSLCLWDTRTCKRIASSTETLHGTTTLAVSPDGRTAATVSFSKPDWLDDVVVLWDLAQE